MYKGYIIDDNTIIIDYSRDFDLEDFNYDAYEEYLENTILKKYPEANVIILNDSLITIIKTKNEDMEEEVEYIMSETDYSDDMFYY